MSTLKVTNIQHPDAANPAITLDANGEVSALSGFASSPIKQVQYVNFDTPTTIESVTRGTYSPVPGFQVSITPQSAGSKIVVFVSVAAAFAISSYSAIFIVERNGSIVNPLPTPGQRLSGHVLFRPTNDNPTDNLLTSSTLLVDSPNSTNELTYSVSCTHNVAGEPWNIYVNRSSSDSDSPQYFRSTSTLLVAELGV